MTLHTADNPLWNEDLSPSTPEQRTWTAPHYAALWVSMAISVPAYMLASGLMSEGMNWWQAVLTVFLGNVIVLIPMVLVGHAGAKQFAEGGKKAGQFWAVFWPSLTAMVGY